MSGVLDGQTAIVTGGGRGVGRAIAESLAAAGAAVAVIARSRDEVDATASEIERAGGRALALVGDVRQRDAVERAVAEVEQRLGPVDLLVNNAGTGVAIGPTWEVDPDEWWRDVEVVLRGAHLCSRAILARMVRRRRGRIVNVTSRAGGFGSPYQSAYSCSRAAVFQLTEALAKEAGPHGIRVFAFTPGMVRTALTESILTSDAGQRWLGVFRQMVEAGNAWVEPETVGRAVVLLASGRADALSGRWIHAPAGVETLLARTEEIVASDALVLRLRE